MTNLPFGFSGDEPEEGAERPAGPADPFSALFGGEQADLGAAFQRLGQLLSRPDEGPVSWSLARETARQALASGTDPSVGAAEQAVVTDALRLAELWLDAATTLPAAGGVPTAWSRAEWVEQTLPQWRALIEPLAVRVAEASDAGVPEQMRAMAGPMLGMLRQLSGAMFGAQVGQGLAALAGEVTGSADVGLPLAPPGRAVLLPANVAAFGEGLGVPLDEVRLSLALREAAHLRLFHRAPWLTGRIHEAVDAYARGISVDTSGIEASLAGLDPTNPEALQEALGSGLFEPPQTADQQAALGRLETLLALVEGWVDDVVTMAAAPHLPSAEALRETHRRRRATGGPAELTFATLVGLQLRPRRLREAAALWQHLREAGGIERRDAVWGHPDLLPTQEDLDDPTGFLAGPDSTLLDLSSLDTAPPAPAETPPDSGSDNGSDTPPDDVP